MKVMVMRSLIILLVMILNACRVAEQDRVWLFSYFTGNGESGMHLAMSEDGYHFFNISEGHTIIQPLLSADSLMRDPCIIQGHDGRFYMVWTVSWNDRGIGLAWSDDLIHWSEQKYLPVMAHEPNARNCWAPEIFYDEVSAHYVIFWSTTISGLYPDTEATADRGWDHRIYYTVTTDFEKYSTAQQFYNHGFNVIDGSMVESDGRYYLFIKDETRYPPQKNIRVATGDRAVGPFSAPSQAITGDYWAEGPTVTRVNGEWVVYFDKYIDKKMGAVASADLINWREISDSVSFPEETRHGSVFTVDRSVADKLKLHFGVH